MNIYYLLVILVTLNIFLFIYHDLISSKINIYDYPGHRKQHKLKTALFGGFIIFTNFIIISICYFTEFKNLLFPENYFFNERSFYIFIFSAVGFFLIGLYDDKYHLNAYTRLFLSIIIMTLLITLDSSLLIEKLKFSKISSNIFLENFSYIFSVFSFMLFINAANMYDGINLQSGIYFIVIFIYVSLYTSIFLLLSLLIIPLLTYLILNFKNKVFLGDSGVYLVSFIISYSIVKTYNIDLTFTADQIFLIMMLPGIELLRLSIIRILNGKNPFSGDRNHLHHYLIDKTNLLNTNLILLFFVAGPLLLYSYVNSIFIVMGFLICYIITILSCRRKT